MEKLDRVLEEMAELRGYLKAMLPQLATKEEVKDIVADAMKAHKNDTHHSSGLTAKQIKIIIGAGVALATAITGILAAGCMPF